MRKDEGFVLADALVALLICSLFLTSFLSLNGTSRHATERGHNRLVAAYIARAVLNDPSIREDAGAFVIDGNTFQWSRVKTDRPGSETDRVTISDLEVTISWTGPSGSPSLITANTVRLRGISNEG